MNQIKKALNESAAARWGIMLLVSFTMAANYYFYDALSPLKELMTELLGFSSSDYGFFVAAYSVPNVFLAMAVIGGIILDKIGIRITGFVFIVFMVIGGCVTAYGSSDYFNAGGIGYHFMNSFALSYSPALKVMTLGFFLFGLGAETSIVVISKIIVKWFKGKELALALGLNLAIARLGMAAALIVSPLLEGLTWPIWLGTILLTIGLLAFLVYMIFDIKIDRQLKKIKTVEEEEEEAFKFSDIRKLLTNPSFIYITLLCVTFYSAVFPFVKYAPDMMVNKFGVSRETSGFITSLLPFATMIFTPLFGWFCDKRGKSASLMIYGSLLLIMVHLMFAFTTITPYIPMFILGIGFSLVPAAMWPSVAKIVDVPKIGTAYGLMFSIQNIGLWAFPMLIGMVLDYYNPNTITDLKPKEFTSIINNDYHYQANYTDREGTYIPDQEMRIAVTIIADSLEGKVVWNESHNVKTNNKGVYNLNITKGDKAFYVDFTTLNFTQDTFYVEVKDIKKDSEIILKDRYVLDSDNYIIESVYKSSFGDLVSDKEIKLELTLFDNEHDKNPVLREIIKTKTDTEGKYSMDISEGKISFADGKFFSWADGKFYLEVKTPLNYTNAMIMLAFLGVLGLLFAFLLRRTDKTSGYGLELPNKQ